MSKQTLADLMGRAGDFFGNASPEVERRMRQMLQSTLTRMDLVTREEFDAQSKVLQHTRQRLEELERIVARLEEETGTQA